MSRENQVSQLISQCLNRLSLRKSTLRDGPAVATAPTSRDAKLFEPLVGWRAWKVSGGLLQSVVWPATWWPGRRLERRHALRTRSFEHPGGKDTFNVCSASCAECGIHAFAAERDAEGYATQERSKVPLILGEVALWGRVEVYGKGYKAQFAYPKSLVLFDPLDPVTILELEKNYGIPVKAPIHAGV